MFFALISLVLLTFVVANKDTSSVPRLQQILYRIESLGTKIGGLKKELKEDNEALRNETNERFDGLRKEFKEDIQVLRNDMEHFYNLSTGEFAFEKLVNSSMKIKVYPPTSDNNSYA
jgi:hypothetical protein